MANGIELAPLVVAVNGDLDNFSSAMDRVEQRGEQTANRASSKLSKIGTGLESVGGKLTSHVSVPLLAVGGIASKIGMDFESEMSRVKAISGATGDEFKLLEDQALSLGQSTAFSAGECAEGMENLASAGFNTKEIMSAMPGLLDLAASSGEDLATSSEIAAGTLRGFGLEAEQAGHVADVLAKNAADTNAAVSDTGEAMKYIAPVAHSMGLSFEEVTAAIGLMSNANIKGSQAGTTLRSALTRLAKPSDIAAAKMKAIGFNAFDSHGKLKNLSEVTGDLEEATKGMTDKQKQNTIATIFGQEAMSGMLVLMDAGPKKIDGLSSSFKDCDGAAKDMADTMQNNTKASVEQAFGALETASIKMLQVAAPAIKTVADGIGDMADKFSSLTPETQELILKMGLFAVAAGPVMSVVGKGISLFSKLTPLVSAAGVATAGAGASAGGAAVGFGALSTVALPLVATIGAVAGGIYLFTKNTEVMNSSCLKSKEDLGFMGNAMLALHGQTALTADEMDRMNIKHKEWSDKISPETQKALTDISDKFANLNFELEHSNGLDGVITRKQIDSLNKKTEDLFNEIREKIKKKAPVVQKEMAEAFKADDNKLDENEKILMKYFDKSQSKQLKELDKYEKEIKGIRENAFKKNRDLTKEELDRIEKLNKKAADIALNNTVKNDQELQAAKANFYARMQNLDMNGLSKLLSEKATARDKEIKISSEKYDEQIYMLESNKNTMSAKEKKAADAEIAQLKDKKEKAIEEEKKKYAGFLEQAMKQYPELVNYIDTSNGQILKESERTNAQQALRYMKHMEGMLGITESGYYKIKDKTTGKMKECYVEVDKATGEITGAWDRSTDKIYGNPIKAREDIDKDLKNGVPFQDITGKYDEEKEKIWKTAIEVQCKENTGVFDWVKTTWSGVKSWFSDNPVEVSSSGGGGNSSSHYNGLDFVPYDGYLARLHKGERVMTADENTKYSNVSNSKSFEVTQNFYGKVDSPYEVYKATQRSMRELGYS